VITVYDTLSNLRKKRAKSLLFPLLYAIRLIFSFNLKRLSDFRGDKCSSSLFWVARSGDRSHPDGDKGKGSHIEGVGAVI
jgi:hypothetical protein